MNFSSMQKAVAFAAALSISLPQAGYGAQAQPASAPAPAPPLAEDPGWPRQVVKNGTTLVYYQPQVDHWNSFQQLDGRAAFSLTPQNGKATVGVASFQTATAVDKDNRTVYLHDFKYTSVRFPSLDAQPAAQAEQLFRAT